MTRISYGIPLAAALAGTVGSLAIGAKKLHVGFGMALTAISLLHAYQHRSVMRKNVSLLRREQKPAGFSNVKTVFYMPGRIRIYCRKGSLAKTAELLKPFLRIGKIEVNDMTNSILILYDKNQVHNYRKVQLLEQYLKSRMI